MIYRWHLFKEGRTQRYTDGVEYLKRTMGEPGADLNAISPAHLAESIKIPVFLAHGGQDNVTPEEHAERMRDALIDAGNEPEWLFYRNEVHGFHSTEHLEEFYTKLLAFFDKHLGG